MGIEVAEEFRKEGRLAEAEAACRDHLKRQPNDPRALHLLGRLA